MILSMYVAKRGFFGARAVLGGNFISSTELH
jgi:hypothetical protein